MSCLSTPRITAPNWQRSVRTAQAAYTPLGRYLGTLCEEWGDVDQLDFTIDGSQVTITNRHGYSESYDDAILAAVATTYYHLYRTHQ